MTKEILLTQSKVALVDDEDYEELNQYKWCANESPTTKGTFYAVRNSGNNRRVYMHRKIMKTRKGECVDHINRNGCDNRKCNLRICNHSQNLHNHKLHRNNTSGLYNVYWSKHGHKWRAYVRENKRKVMIGNFDTKEEAGRAYDKKAKELYGEFAVLNFPDKK